LRKPVVLPNGREWPTKKEAEQHFRDMLAKFRDGETIPKGIDHDDLVALLQRYDLMDPIGPPKIGVGVDHFERRLNRTDFYSASGFWVVRTDGSATDFSYPTAVRAAPQKLEQEFSVACHNAVGADLRATKEYEFDHFPDQDGCVPCDVTGKPVSFTEANLSHAEPSFAEIVKQFRKKRGWDKGIPSGIVTTAGDAQISSDFEKQSDADDFRAFHRSAAVLRIVAKDRPSGSLASTPVKHAIKIR